jgi:aminopeptidase YwaD
MEIVRFLAEQIGPRPAGGHDEPEVLAFLTDRLKEAGLKTRRESFAFRSWDADGEWLLSVRDSDSELSLKAVPFPYTNPESITGLAGVLEWEGEWPVIPGRLVCPRFGIRDGQREIVASVVGSPAGAARPLPNPNPILALPTVVVSADDAVRLRELVGNGARPSARITGGAIREGLRRSSNLIAEPAETQPWLTVTAHYDCVPGSPGANDNATGVSLLIRLARRAGSSPSDSGIRFILFGAEEPFLAGSRSYVAAAGTNGELSACRASLNLDMVAVGARFAVRSVPESFWAQAAEQLPGHSPGGVPIVRTELYPASDHWAFHEVGIPSAQLTREPDLEWHSPGDRIGRFDHSDLDDAEAVAVALIEQVRKQIESSLEVSHG